MSCAKPRKSDSVHRVMLEGMHIHFCHEGKAPYPDISAYRTFFGDQCSISEGLISDIPQNVRPERLILWYMMGFYPTRSAARLIIHDYRSLSVGRARRLKDLIKRAFNATPDLRIFQNEIIRSALGFRQDHRSLLIPMGVPSWTFDLKWCKEGTTHDFGYVGMINVERGFRGALRSFVRAYNGSRTWLLIGPAEQTLLDEFATAPGLEFAGRLPQQDALKLLLSTRCGIALFPGHPPHCWQTPTKLLEYAALGLPILANDSPMNLRTIELHDIKAMIRPGDLFDSEVDPSSLPANDGSCFRHLDFQAILRDSGVAEAITERLAP